MPNTRKNVECVVFGAPTELKCNILPTYSDVMRAYLCQKQLIKEQKNGKDPSVSEVSKKVLFVLKNIWQNASLHVVSDQEITRLIKDYVMKFRNLKKNIGSVHNKKCLEKLEKFRQTSEKLFDISICKCKDFNLCMCKNKVPKTEQEFLKDQRTERKMFIGNVDVQLTKVLQNRMERKAKAKKGLMIGQNSQDNIALITESNVLDTTSSPVKENDDLSESSSSSASEFNFHIDSPSTTKTTKKDLRGVNFNNLAEACDRTGVSDRSASLLVNAVLQDLGVVSRQDPSKLLNRSKLRRERKRRRTELKKESTNNLKVTAVYFDGRKDRTLVMEKKGNTFHKKYILEEHIVLIAEPESIYLGHVTPSSGNAKNIKSSIFDFLSGHLGSVQEIVAIGCDGTVVNTGFKNGVIKQLEVEIGHSLQWLICLFHANELPLRHLIEKIDGKTNDPKGFSGPIGKLLLTCQNLPVVKFKKINGTLPEFDLRDSSTDQIYLYEICSAIARGDVPLNLLNREPGKMGHARWLTTANRVLRLYVGTEQPSNELKTLAEFIVKVYAPVWFDIKIKSSCTEGPRHLFSLITRSRYLTPEIKAVIDPVIRRNAFFAHPENILLAMITDHRKHIRQLGLRRILKCRVDGFQTSNIRQFKVPELNFEAQDYTELINWQSVTVTEPPLTKQISNDTLQEMIVTVPGDIEILKYPYPCHSQAVERCIRTVSEASALVSGAESRDGLIRSRIVSRTKIPKTETRQQFLKALEQ